MNRGNKTVLRDLSLEPKKLLNFKLTEKEELQIRELAKKYAGGNVSGWVRYTALNYKPSKKELSNE